MAPGRSSDSQARPVACLLAIATTAFAMAGKRPPSRCFRQMTRRSCFRALVVLTAGGHSIARTQRRGRPGISPEFPVCREHRRARRPPRPSINLAGGQQSSSFFRVVLKTPPQTRRPLGCGVTRACRAARRFASGWPRLAETRSVVAVGLLQHRMVKQLAGIVEGFDVEGVAKADDVGGWSPAADAVLEGGLVGAEGFQETARIAG